MKIFFLILVMILMSCEGNLSYQSDSINDEGPFTRDDPKNPQDKDPDPALKGPISPGDQSAKSAIPRLSQREYESIIFDVFDLPDLAKARLPLDVAEPFDTDQNSKKMSKIFVEGLESLATEVATQASADSDWLNGIAGCLPALDDRKCWEDFTQNLGTRLWRTKFPDKLKTELVDKAITFSNEANDISFGVRYIIQSILQSPRFVYRVENGEANGDFIRFTNEELVVKLSFLLWGTGPSSEALAGIKNEAYTSSELVVLAKEMMNDERFEDLIKTFHAMWFGYKKLNTPADLEPRMIAETDALLDRVLANNSGLPWGTLFLSDETFVDPELATHYEMEDVAETGWVKYQNPSRAGVLSHGSILSIAARDGNDTSVTGRGKEIADIFLCRTIEPPPANLVIVKPEATEELCKFEAYENIQKEGGLCAACHIQMDPIGTGLEQFDGLGKYREIEYGNENCRITGKGQVVGMGEFNGPKELSKLALDSGQLTECATEQFLRFVRGGFDRRNKKDQELRKRLHLIFEKNQDFRELILAIIEDPTFRFRKDQE